MLYSQDITVPADTAIADYTSTTMKLTKGVVTRVVVFFPWGCAGLCGVQIIRGTWQVFPLSRGEWLVGNDRPIDFHTEIALTTEPYELIVRAYNLDDTYDHTPIVSIGMVKDTMEGSFLNILKILGGK
jgi:hypothetical protein